MTTRIDSKLKTAADAFAEAQGISLTELVQRSLKSFLTPICPTCGRSTAANVVAPGFSEGFDKFLDEITKNSSNSTFVLLTEELGRHFVYWVRRHPNRRDSHANAGVVMVNVLPYAAGMKVLSTGIPRGVLVGWRLDEDGQWFESYRTLGWLDGNMNLYNHFAATALQRPRR